MSRKLVLLVLVGLTMIAGVSANHYYGDSGTSYTVTDTSFSIPQFDSQEEILSELVAPFIFVSVLLQILFNRALRFAFVDKDAENRSLLDLLENDRPPSVQREATVMSLAVTAMLVPSPFWNYIRLAAASIGVVSVTLVAAGVFYLFYLFVRG